MNEESQFYSTETGPVRELDELVDAAVSIVHEPAADFVQQFQMRLKTSGVPVTIENDRVAREIARILVLDIVQSGIRALPPSSRPSSDVVLEIYEQACARCDEAVSNILDETSDIADLQDIRP